MVIEPLGGNNTTQGYTGRVSESLQEREMRINDCITLLRDGLLPSGRTISAAGEQTLGLNKPLVDFLRAAVVWYANSVAEHQTSSPPDGQASNSPDDPASSSPAGPNPYDYAFNQMRQCCVQSETFLSFLDFPGLHLDSLPEIPPPGLNRLHIYEGSIDRFPERWRNVAIFTLHDGSRDPDSSVRQWDIPSSKSR